MIAGTYSYFKTVANGGTIISASGYDITFYSDSTLLVPLKFERVYWNASTGASEFHVKIPTLSHTANTNIYCKHGYSGVTTDQQDKVNVWDSNFLAVYHFGDGSTLTLTDSTSNGFTLTNHSATAGAGNVTGAAALSGSSQYMDGGTSSTLDLTSDLTFEAILKPTNFTGFNGILSRCNSNVPDPYDWYVVASSGKPRFFCGNGSANTNVDGTTALNANAWNYTAVVMSGTNCTIDANGTSNTATLSTSRAGHTRTLYVGNRADSATMFTGSFDEIRISNTPRSADWRLATKNNLMSPSTFYTIS